MSKCQSFEVEVANSSVHSLKQGLQDQKGGLRSGEQALGDNGEYY